MSESKDQSASTSGKAATKTDRNKTQETQLIDPELDITSVQFNPLKALYAPTVRLPVENAPIYNNLAHYESAMRFKQQQHASGDSSVSEQKQFVCDFFPRKFPSIR